MWSGHFGYKAISANLFLKVNERNDAFSLDTEDYGAGYQRA